MREPGLDRHDWETEWANLEPELEDSPREALPALGDLVDRMVRERGIPAGEPVADEDAEEIFVSLREAREIADRVDSAEDVDPGDVAVAVNLYREVYDYMIAEFRE
ncbi:MAG TPA: hypothetical protein VHK22_02025 [Gaiellaceae bacterium]|jgi:hypothetical protein|nr:hypothetical protein [Gaiellaceae bacterium]